ncbi:MAG: phage major capsid protein [Rhodopseudomonas palustris]|nr:MAG: phage major capsid protein [Rhodopseudomonas palustris]
MSLSISETENLALRKHALPTVRALGVKDAEEYEPHRLSWKLLNEHANVVMKRSRQLVDSLSDDMQESEVRSINVAVDTLTSIWDAINAERETRAKLGERGPRASGGNPMRPAPGDGSCMGQEDDGEREEREAEERFAARSGWADKRGTEIRVLMPKDKFATEPYRGPSMGECLRAMITGPRNEFEKRALSEGSDSAGGFTVPTPLAMQFIDKLRAKSVLIRAGATTIPMDSQTLSIARLATDPTFAWRAENAEIAASDPTFERVQLEAKSVAGIVRVSRELLEDSVNIAAALENAFTKGMALEFDRAGLYGSGNDDEPIGVALTSGINEVSMGDNGGVLTADKMIDAIFEPLLDNAETATAMIYNPRTGRDYAKLKDGEGNPLSLPKIIESMPHLMTTSVPINETQGSSNAASSIILGYWPELLIGLRSSLRIEVLKERYAEYHQYAFVAHMRGDFQLAHKASFCRLKGIKTPA